MARAFAKIAFTPSVREIQAAQGSAESYAKFLEPEAERGDRLSEREASFIAARDGFYLATVSETGWPYVQFRGGPAGFVRILDDRNLAYADFRGNRQYLSVGNLNCDDRVSLILMDYANRRRLKIWGRARIVDATDDPKRIEGLRIAGYRALPERAVIVTVEAYDWNCPQHIPQRLTLQELEPHLATLRDEMDLLTTENAALRSSLMAAQPERNA